MSEQPPLDPSALQQLYEINPEDGGEFVRDLIGIFLTDTPRRILELQKALAGGEAAHLTLAAHSIKGSAGNFGATGLAGIAQELEQSGRRADLGAADIQLAALQAEYARVEQALLAIQARG